MKTICCLVNTALGLVQLQAQDLSEVFPALKTLTAPVCIREGVRLNYYGSTGDIPNSDFNKWGGELGQWDYATAPSGHGYTQVDVVAVAQGIAALNVQAWQYSDWTGPLIPVRGGQSGLVCYAGGGDWWVHPQVLAEMQEIQGPDLAILKVPQILDGKSYAAIRIQRVTDKSRQATVYDLSTGLLLFKGTALQTANTTFASQMFYKGSRQLPTGSRPSPIPLWLQPGVRLLYQGQYTTQVIGNPPFSLPLDVLAQVLAVGDGWFLYDQTTSLSSIGGMPPTVEKATLVGGGGNLYIAPTVLNALQVGAILDTDPITGSQLLVAARTGNTVTLRTVVGTVSLTEFSFDAVCGLMTGFRSWDSTDPILQTASQLNLTQWPDFNAGTAPTLTILSRGQSIVLSCRNAGGRLYSIESSVDGEPWQTVGTLSDQQEWVTPVVQAQRCVLFRLRS